MDKTFACGAKECRFDSYRGQYKFMIISFSSAYFILTIPFIIIWLLLFIFSKKTRKEQLIMSILFLPVGTLSEIIYFQDYWNPGSILFTQIGSIRILLEDFIFSFCIAGGLAKTTTGQGSTSGGGSGGTVTIEDPLDLGPGGPMTLYARLIQALLGFVGISSLVTFIYAGFLFIFSGGSADKTLKAKQTMLYAVIGIVVSMASYAILSFIFETLEKGTGN